MTDTVLFGAGAKRARKPSFLWKLPTFIYVLIVFIVMSLSVTDMRVSLFNTSGYSLSAVELIYIIASFVAMSELLRVSKPGIDNTGEALWMLGIWIIYLVLFVLGAVGIPFLAMFATTEFLMLTALSAFQVVTAFLINARTLKRTIDTSSSFNNNDL